MGSPETTPQNPFGAAQAMLITLREIRDTLREIADNSKPSRGAAQEQAVRRPFEQAVKPRGGS